MSIWVAFAAPMAQAGIEHVTDRVGLFTPKSRGRIEAAGQRLLEEFRIPINVLTIRSLREEGAGDVTILEFADSLFERAVGEFESLNGQDWTMGIFLVRSSEDNALTIRFGVGWDDETRVRLEEVSRDAMVPRFSRGRYAAGIAAAAEGWEAFIRENEPAGPSYLDRFLMLEKASVQQFFDQLQSPTWRNDYFFPWLIIPILLLERIRPWRKKQRFLRKGIALDFWYVLFNQCLFWAFLGSAITGITAFVFNDLLQRFFGVQNIVALHLADLPVWSRYVLLLLVVDFWNYWIHRMLHRVDFLWEFHKVHHSSRQLDVMNAIRLHPFETLVYQFVAYIPVGMIGFAVADAFVVTLFLNFFSYYTHANVRIPLGPLKYVLNNPQLHIWHHTVEVRDRGNVNFGDALSLWDFLFGTGHAPPDRTDQKLGFENIEDYPTGFFGQLVAPLRRR